MTLKTTGFSSDTAKNLLLDAGAIYKNFDKTSLSGELIGATQGGNSFLAQPEMRNIEIDGVKSEYVKGLTVIDGWEVSLTANLLEVTKESLALAIGVSEEGAATEGYESIRGKNYIVEEDYLDNVAFVGKLSGADKPVIIIVENALNHEGMELEIEDASEGVLPVTFFGHIDADNLDSAPFEILYPTGVGAYSMKEVIEAGEEEEIVVGAIEEE